MAKTTTVKTLKKWEEELNAKFSYDLSDRKVCRLRCETCCTWEERISTCKNFSLNWIRPGSESISKDSVKKHVSSIQHKEAEKFNSWIIHKYRAMEKVLENYGPYIAHLESLCHTNSQALKRAELTGQAKKWKDATYLMYMAIYLDILAPIRRISLAMQSDFHDPVKVVKRIKEFRWN